VQGGISSAVECYHSHVCALFHRTL